MENSSFYTKGEKEEVISRISQVHTITMYCPLRDFCIQSLKSSFELMLPKYKKGENLWKGVPAIDALNVFIFTTGFVDTVGLEVNKDVLSVIASSLKMFKKLKKINFEFTDDEDIENTYNILLKKSKEGIKKYIYKVELLEMNLSDLFSQRIIDLLNKIFVYNEMMPNSYLERKFKLDFKYDEYVSFIDMFINNNKENLDSLDNKICDYFRAFPKLVNEQKPNIRILTNYSDEVTG